MHMNQTSNNPKGNNPKPTGPSKQHLIDLHVGKRLKSRRIFLGITQQDLADFVGKTFQQVQKYENGANRISSGVLYIFATKLGVEIQFFFDEMPDGIKSNDVFTNLDLNKIAQVYDEEFCLDQVKINRALSRMTNPIVRQRLVALASALADDNEQSAVSTH
jgi:transcriptional regulator with XRE-family HTH domain